MSKTISSASSAVPPRRRMWPFVAAGVLLLILMAIAATPMLLTGGMVSSLVSNRIPGRLQIDRAKLSWLSGQHLEGLSLFGVEGDLIARVLRIDAPELKLLGVISGKRDFGRVTVQVEQINLKQHASGTLNLAQAVLAQDTGRSSRSDVADKNDGPADPLRVQLAFTADRIRYEAPDMEPVELSKLDISAKIPDLRKIDLAVKGSLQQGDLSGQVDATVALQDAFTIAGEPQLEKATINGDARVRNLPMVAVDRLANQQGKLVTLLGPQLDATVQAQGPMNQLQARVQATSEHLKVNTQITSAQDTLRASPDSTISLRVTPAAFAQWTAGETGSPPASRLLAPFNLDIRISELSVPSSGDLAAAAVNAAIVAGDIKLDVKDLGNFNLTGTNLSVKSAKLADQIDVALNATANVAGRTDPVNAQLAMRHAMASGDRPAALDASLTAKDLPLPLVDAVLALNGKLTDTLGPALNTTANVRQNAAGDMIFDTRLSSSQVTSGAIAGQRGKDGMLSLKTTEPIRMNLTPAGFARWTAPEPQPGGAAEPGLVLEQPLPITINLSQVDLAMVERPAAIEGQPAPLPIDPKRTRIDATVELGAARFFDPRQNRRVQVDGGRLVVQASDLSSVIKLMANLKLRDPQASPGSISASAAGLDMDGEVRHLINEAGALDARQAMFNGNVKAQQVPTSLVSTFIGGGADLPALLGPTTSANVTARQVSLADPKSTNAPGGGGQLDLDLQSDNAQGLVQATVSGGALTLREDATLNLRVTPEMARQFLAGLNPLLMDVQGMRDPVSLTVHRDTFEYKLAEQYDPKNLRAAGQLKMGAVQMRRGIIGGALISALRAAGSPIQDRQEFDARFTDLTFDVRDGVVKTNDLWMDTGDMLLGTQARRDLGSVDTQVVMAIPGETLHMVPGAAKRIPASAIYDASFNFPSDNITRIVTNLVLSVAVSAAGDVTGRPEVGAITDIVGGLITRPRQAAPGGTAAPNWSDPKWPNRPVRASPPAATGQEPASQEPMPAQPQPQRPTGGDLLQQLLESQLRDRQKK